MRSLSSISPGDLPPPFRFESNTVVVFTQIASLPDIWSPVFPVDHVLLRSFDNEVYLYNVNLRFASHV